MKFRIDMDTDNDAFGTTERARNAQVATILQALAATLRQQSDYDYALMDANGNKVGTASFRSR